MDLFLTTIKNKQTDILEADRGVVVLTAIEPSMTHSIFAGLIVNRNLTKELLSCFFT